ncbi:hypothetical protein AMTR_s00130p00118290 [Amborella trichopoda]|uniref:SWIM-type domain-containing protein n=1 Tax=Amborella trichopoda TaxID=13333 RepID=W1NRQ4_AMBTC|nr:hypothetical protein AMTR_s00130p00118290 [Amborella trichopoda]
MYEINADKKYAVNLVTHTCSCWVWQVSGLSCSHAIAAVDHRHQDVTEFCGVYFTIQIYHRANSLPFNPMPDTLELQDIVYGRQLQGEPRVGQRSNARAIMS